MAGSEPDRRQVALSELRACAQRLGRSPSMREFAADPRTTLHPQAIAKLWGAGGWNAAKQQAGLEVRRRVSDQEMLDGIARLAGELGRPPRARDINADRRLPSVSLYLERFDGLADVHRRAGVSDDCAQAELDEMVGQGVELYADLGRLPSWSDWVHARRDEPQLISEWRIYRRFGGAEGAWSLFCYVVLEAAQADR